MVNEQLNIPWIRRLTSFTMALRSLRRGVELANERSLSDIERLGLIHTFECTHGLAWNVLKDYLEEQGVWGVEDPADASRAAFRNALIEDGDAWMHMIEARERVADAYNGDVAEAMVRDVAARFFPAFVEMEKRFAHLAAAEGAQAR